MNKPDTKTIIESIGIFGVIASLVFVGMQLRLEQNIALGGQYHDRTESRKSDLRAYLESETYMSRISREWEAGDRPGWWNEDFENDVRRLELSGSEVHSRILRHQIEYLQMDNNFYQYEQGLLSFNFYIGNRNFLKDELRDPFTRAVYTEMRGLFMINILSELIAEIENE